MAINLLLPLLAGGGIKMGIERSLAQQDRNALQQAMQQQFGRGNVTGAPMIGSGPTLNPDGSIAVGGGAAGPGMFSPQQMAQGAIGLFGAPGGAELGSQLFRDAASFYHQQQQQLAGFGQRDLEQERQQDFTATQDELDRNFRAEQNQMDRQQREAIAAAKLQAQANAALPGGPARQGSVPAGFNEYIAADGSSYLAPAPGSQPYIDAQTEIETSENAIREIDTMLESIRASGSEMFGAEAGRQGLRYRNIVAAIAQLQNLGVLQEAEAERLENSIPDPSSITGATTSNDRMIAAYEELQKLFQNKLRGANRKYSLWGLGSQLETATPREQREAEAQAQAAAAAQLQGITIDQSAAANPPMQNQVGSIVGDATRRGMRQAIGGLPFIPGGPVLQGLNAASGLFTE